MEQAGMSGIAIFIDGYLSFANEELHQLLDFQLHFKTGVKFKQLLFDHRIHVHTRKLMLALYKAFVIEGKDKVTCFDVQGKCLSITLVKSPGLKNGYVVYLHDLTVKQEASSTTWVNEQMMAIGNIAASVAHEIRNPLTSIRGFVQLLKPYLSQLNKEQYVNIIIDEIDRANGILYELLATSRPTLAHKEMTSITKLVSDVVLLCESEALLKDCRLHLTVTCADMSGFLDSKQMKQVLINIVRNSIDATSESSYTNQGSIHVSVRTEGPHCVINIKDNGHGMDEETQRRIFDPFFTTKHHGTGLGLAVSQQIIQHHGGIIRVQSALGMGTETTIYLPILAEQLRIG